MDAEQLNPGATGKDEQGSGCSGMANGRRKYGKEL